MQLPTSISAALTRINRPSRTIADSQATVGRFLFDIVRYHDVIDGVRRLNAAALGAPEVLAEECVSCWN